jgi:hypothetical protein
MKILLWYSRREPVAGVEPHPERRHVWAELLFGRRELAARVPAPNSGSEIDEPWQ